MLLPDSNTLWLLLALLLCFWLLTRVRASEVVAARRTPVTLDELGRSIFSAGRSGDFAAYRELYLAGGEAEAVFGERAGEYLDRRTRPALAGALERLGTALRPGCHFHSLLLGEDGQAYLQVREPGGAVLPVPVGSAVQVGAAWRLVDPPPVGS
jgi:integrase